MSLLDALNFKSDVSICKLVGRMLNIFAPWNAKVLRPVSVFLSYKASVKSLPVGWILGTLPGVGMELFWFYFHAFIPNMHNNWFYFGKSITYHLYTLIWFSANCKYHFIVSKRLSVAGIKSAIYGYLSHIYSNKSAMSQHHHHMHFYEFWNSVSST